MLYIYVNYERENTETLLIQKKSCSVVFFVAVGVQTTDRGNMWKCWQLSSAGDANKLYAAASWGACFLAAPAGVCFDALGPAWPCAQCRYNLQIQVRYVIICLNFLVLVMKWGNPGKLSTVYSLNGIMNLIWIDYNWHSFYNGQSWSNLFTPSSTKIIRNHTYPPLGQRFWVAPWAHLGWALPLWC